MIGRIIFSMSRRVARLLSLLEHDQTARRGFDCFSALLLAPGLERSQCPNVETRCGHPGSRTWANTLFDEDAGMDIAKEGLFGHQHGLSFNAGAGRGSSEGLAGAARE